MNNMQLLIERIRGSVPSNEVTEKRMFGGITFMLKGNMLCCVSNKGLMVRLGKDAEAAALARPHAQPCLGTGHRMPGFIMVDFEGISDNSDLASWLNMAMSYVSSLPPKAPSAKHRSTSRKSASRSKRSIS